MRHPLAVLLVLLVLLVLTGLAAFCCAPFSPETDEVAVGVSAETSATLKVLSLNIAGGAGSGQWRLPAARETQAQFLRDVAADVVCLQEVDVGTTRNFGADAIDIVGDAGSRVFGEAIALEGGGYGNALWFRDGIEVLDWENHAYVNPGTWTDLEVRRTLEVRILVGTLELKVACTHLAWVAADAKDQATQLKARLSTVDVLLGDFNLEDPDFTPLKRKTARLQLPWSGIDQVWSHFPGDGGMVPTNGASDHPYAALGVLQLRGSP